MLAVIVTAFVDGDLFPHFPAKEGVGAVGAEVFRLFVLAEALVGLEQVVADLAPKLGFFLAVVVVEIVVRGVAKRTNDQLWN